MSETSMTLYNIDRGILDLINSADENGEIDAVAFDDLQMAKKDKMLNIVHYVNFIGGNIDLIDNEIKRLQGLKRSVAARETSLKAYMKRSMELEGLDKMDFGTFQLSIRNNPGSLVIDDEDKISPMYKKVVEMVTIDKIAIKNALKSGEAIVGCHIESGTSLTIK